MNNRLEIYDKVNSCESLEELATIIESLADEDGNIQGRTKKFDAYKMATYCREFSLLIANALTREYGIRQQAIYLVR